MVKDFLNMYMLYKKIFFTPTVSLILFVCLFGSTTVLAQSSSFSSSSDTVATSSTEVASSSSYSSNEVGANRAPVYSSGIASLLENLKVFGQNIGMSYVDPRTILARIIKSGMGFIGIIVLVIILWSGLRIMLSGGDEEKSSHAKKGFVNMLIGLFIILSAYSIVTFILGALNNTANTPGSTESNPVTPDPVVNP